MDCLSTAGATFEVSESKSVTPSGLAEWRGASRVPFDLAPAAPSRGRRSGFLVSARRSDCDDKRPREKAEARPSEPKGTVCARPGLGLPIFCAFCFDILDWDSDHDLRASECALCSCRCETERVRSGAGSTPLRPAPS